MYGLNKWWLIVIGFMLLGTAITIQDYRQWRYEETSRFGQGSLSEQGVEPALPLGLAYTSNYARFRLRPPSDWQIKENSDYAGISQFQKALPTNRTELARFTDISQTATIAVYLERATGNLTELSDQEAGGITRDRQYFSMDGTNLTVLTWDGADSFIQKAMSVNGDTLLVIESTTTQESWKKYIRTFEAVYQSLIWY